MDSKNHVLIRGFFLCPRNIYPLKSRKSASGVNHYRIV